MQQQRPDFCNCGSGLRSDRCCQLNWSLFDKNVASDMVQTAMERAIVLMREGREDSAEKLVLEILELAPTEEKALGLLLALVKQRGQTSLREILLRRLVRVNPNNFWSNHDLAMLLLGNGQVYEAIIFAKNAVRVAPRDARAHALIGMVYTESLNFNAGEYHYKKSLELGGQRDAVVLANLAWNLKSQGRFAEARALFEECVTTQPKMPQVLLNWARMEEADRNFGEAERLLDLADALAPNDANLTLARAIVHGRKGQNDRALNLLGSIAARRDGGTQAPAELLERGRLLDKMKMYDEAFVAFAEGKQKYRTILGHSYSAGEVEELFTRLKAFFVADRMKLLPRAEESATGPRPLFVLGFPRSGTTLVEQILSSHPNIAAGDELTLVGDIVGLLPRILGSPLSYPEALSELWMGDQLDGLETLRDYYVQRARRIRNHKPHAAWLTDKMPLNEAHLGLISLIFPKSPLIHVVRHPLDVMISVFSNFMTHGHFMAYDLESAARHYALVIDLVEHYVSNISAKYLRVRYEDIIMDQENVVRKMLDFIGEPFDAKCLAFNESERRPRTPSYSQVSEKIYDQSLYRHRHYLRHLAPILPILEPVIERLGYDLSESSGVLGGLRKV